MDLCIEHKTVMKEKSGEIRVISGTLLLFGIKCCKDAAMS